MLDALSDTYIGTVRARAGACDRLALQIRLGRVLSALSLRPSGVPASAVVCVRRLSAPPLKSARAGRGVAHASEWDRAVESSLARLVERAARPARGAVPPDAEAVLFFDRAELLACLASDWLAGAASVRWWWRGILKGAEASRALFAAWLDAPEYVPSALEQLARAGRAAAFVGTLAGGEARALLHRLSNAFALDELKGALAQAATRDDGEVNGDGDARSLADAGRQHGLSGGGRGPAPPWRQHLLASERAGLGREQESLLGVGLTLSRAPSHARSPSFARAVRAWRGGATEAADDANITSREYAAATNDAGAENGARVSPPSRSFDGVRSESFAAQSVTETHARVAKDLSRGASEQEGARGASEAADAMRACEASRRTEGEGPADDTGGAARALRPSARGLTHAPPRQSAPRHFDATSETDAEVAASAPAHTESSPAEETWPQVPWPLEARAETKLGGLFYLVNLGLYLELYGDFTTPLQPGLALPLWDFVALLGRRLCVEGEGEEDAVWALLARLAGRAAGEEAGRDFAAPDEWRVPTAWLAPFAERAVWEWSARGGRLRVRHPQGFLILDVPRRARVASSRQLRDETDAYACAAEFELRRATSAADEESVADEEGASGVGLERWVGWLAAYARARLGRALGQDSPAELARLLLRHEATARVTATHVDVLFELARLPLEVRLAGLDRDPGWVPAAGRFIAFRYD